MTPLVYRAAGRARAERHTAACTCLLCLSVWPDRRRLLVVASPRPEALVAVADAPESRP